jgi:predicted MFS family arabinose efflux permease
VAVVFRSIAFVGLSTFIALYIQQRLGGGTATGTLALFVFYLGGVVGSVLGGNLAKRWDRVRVSRWPYLITAIAIAGVVWVPARASTCSSPWHPPACTCRSLYRSPWARTICRRRSGLQAASRSD